MSHSERGLWILLVAALLAGFIGLGPEGGTSALSGAPGDAALPGTTPGGAVQNPTGATSGGTGGTTTGGTGAATTGGTGAATTGGTGAGAGLKCAPGQNGGRTDRGITPTQVKLASTVVLDGPAQSLLRWSLTGMQAVINRVNRQGGICGRLLKLDTRNDSFNAQVGQQYIRNFIEEDYFALPVVPSAEGLGSAILGGYVARAGIPVVGSDGMRVEQYKDPWVWPVATATVSTMRAMATYAAKTKGAKTFAIVWDSKYKFGKEGADAFKRQVTALGGTLKADVALNPELNSYASDVQKFNGNCANRSCDMVALLLLPDTAATWIKAQPELGGKYTAGAQTLFTDQFAQDCIQHLGGDCDHVAAWTGYNPAIGANKGLEDINRYINEVQAIAPGAPVTNQFMHGAYLGMSVFVEALQKVGPNLTRARLKEVLSGFRYRTDLSSALAWGPGSRAANTKARGYSIVYQGGNFQGWRDDNTGFVADPAGGP
jgi:ABC-type branched-subunit amino acid transport system substrate-binding protein